MFRVTRHRIGQAIGRTRCLVTQIDKGIRVAHSVFNVLNASKLVPDGKIKRAAQSGFNDIELIREKVRNAGTP